MEQYHIFKLGLTLLLCTIFYTQPTLVYGLRGGSRTVKNEGPPDPNEYYDYFQGVEGKPYRDYPSYSYIPKTTFTCRNLKSGYYADLETDCQVFHICEDGRKISFLCPNGTIFQQSELICEWWNKVNCTNSPYLYEESAEKLQNDVARRKSWRKSTTTNGGETNQGSVIRTEERISSRSRTNRPTPTRPTASRTNTRIPNNNEIEQHIVETAESNNRHLANAQRTQNLADLNKLKQTSKDIGLGRQQKKLDGSLDSGEQFRQQKKIDHNVGNQFNFGDKYESKSGGVISRGSTKFSSKLSSNLDNQNSDGGNQGKAKDNSALDAKLVIRGNSDAKTPSGIDSAKFSSKLSYNQNTDDDNQGKSENPSRLDAKLIITGNADAKTPSTFGTTKFSSYNLDNQNTEVSNQGKAKDDSDLDAKLVINGNADVKTPSNFGTTKFSSYNQDNQNTDVGNQGKAKDDSDLDAKLVINGNADAKTPSNFGSVKFSSYNLDNQDTDVGYQGKAKDDSNLDAKLLRSGNSDAKIPSNIIATSVGADTQTSQEASAKTLTEPYNNPSASLDDKVVTEHLSKHPVSSNSLIPTLKDIIQVGKSNTNTPVSSDLLPVGDIHTKQVSSSVQASEKINLPNIPLTDNVKISEELKPIVESESSTSTLKETDTLLVSNNYNEPISDVVTTDTDSQKKEEANTLAPSSNYDVPFPTHKSESAGTVTSKQAYSTIASTNNLENHRLKPEDVSGETQITQESSSFVKNSFNDIKDSTFKPLNHKSTYSDIKDLPYLEAPKFSPISSITPHLVTTQPINSGKPFFGSRVGTTLLPNQPTTLSKHTYLPRGSTQSSNEVQELFNVGNTDKTLPAVEITTAITNPLPTEPFNVGNTESTFTPNVVPEYHTSTYNPPVVSVPQDGSLNLGKLEPVNEPLFVKKTVPLLYDGTVATESPLDASTLSGSSSSNTPYSPTVPTVTERYTIGSGATKGVPVKFEKGQDRISLQLSKNVFNDQEPIGKDNGEYVRFNTQVRVKETTPISNAKHSGFLVTNQYTIEKARPFSKASDFLNEFNKKTLKENEEPIIPTYQISSPKPFSVNEETETTILTSTQATPTLNVYDNVDNMINVLQEIASYNANNKQNSRPGLVIPPSVGPDTLHSLAQYFANEVQSDQEDLPGDTRDQLTSLLTAMTVHGYNSLFTGRATPTEEASTTISSSLDGIKTETRVGEQPEASSDAPDDGLTTTALPELRQLARNFSLALSSYLNDPDNFKRTLEGLRPTEPPPLEGTDITDNISNADEELLSFSDQDTKPTTTSSPSPSWNFILAKDAEKGFAEDVKNSLGSDLNTADSQSFIPRYNDLKVDEKPQPKGFTDLPPNHWTTNPQATTLWQKALSVNPALVNGHLETTPASITSGEESAEAELYSTDTPLTQSRQSEINYDLRQLPTLTLNSTQVHGILIDFMNTSKLDEHNRLHRLLKKLNTSEEEFLNRMKEIESNPLTKRLILLLISECGADAAKDLKKLPSIEGQSASEGNFELKKRENHDLGTLVNGELDHDHQDSRALQLLNSLYTIASRFGKKR
ncbi:uncharacterized protein LOC143196620 [Rhynchophorus ferrugineus]|uniref:uncharacterized protein LOC143196620 n=1 Tax=Rhynchophorus ferrugineus TaxID=354439 RepID=UPI003FCED108